MEPAVQLPRYIFFDAGLRCFGPAPPPVELPAADPSDTAQVLALDALHRTRVTMSRVDLATRRPDQTGAVASCDRARICDPDTVSDAGTSGVGVTGESDDEVDSFDELFFDLTFARKIDALAELVGMNKGTCEPADVLGEVVRLLQEMNRKIGCSA